MLKEFQLSKKIKLQDGTTISIDKKIILKANSWEELGQEIINEWKQGIMPISESIIKLLNKHNELTILDNIYYSDIRN